MVSFYRGHQIGTLGDMEDYVLIPEAARMLGMSRQTLWRHVDRGHVPAEKVGRDYVIKRTDLEAFDAVRKKTPGRPPKPSLGQP